MSYRKRYGRTHIKARNSEGSTGQAKHAYLQCVVSCPAQKPCFKLKS